MSSANNSALLELLAKARQGETEARDRLFETCRNYVAVVARTHVESWLRTKVDASDLVQQTLLDAHRGFQEFRGETEAEWLAWLRRILVHNATDFVRRYQGTAKRRAGREVPIGTGDDSQRPTGAPEPASPEATPSEILMQHEQQLLVADALTRLSPDYQEVIMLRSLQRLPFEEVARRMNRSRPAVQMLWARAIQKLQAELES